MTHLTKNPHVNYINPKIHTLHILKELWARYRLYPKKRKQILQEIRKAELLLNKIINKPAAQKDPQSLQKEYGSFWRAALKQHVMPDKPTALS
jgi:hypothetical protein